MNSPLEYCEHEHKALNNGNMRTLMENHPTDLPLQGCVGTHSVHKSMPVARQTSTNQTPVIDVNHHPSNRRLLFQNNLGLQCSSRKRYLTLEINVFLQHRVPSSRNELAMGSIVRLVYDTL